MFGKWDREIGAHTIVGYANIEIASLRLVSNGCLKKRVLFGRPVIVCKGYDRNSFSSGL